MDANNGAATAHVLFGKTFWGLLSGGGWGLLTGTMPDNGAVTITPGPSNQAIAAGYHNGSGSVQGDMDLTPENIVAGVTIFDVTGTAPTLTPDPNFTSENIACGVTVYGVMGDYGRRFRDNGDGTVADLITGLMWTENANHGRKDWHAAKQYCHDLDYAGYDDWRLPNRDELASIIDNQYVNPALSNACRTGKWTPGDAFTGVQSSYYWSSTYPQHAYYVDLYSGNVHYGDETNNYYIWPVRGYL